MTSCVDRGRTALAEAEAAAFGGTDLEVERGVDELVARAAQVTSGSWWRAAGGPAVTVRPSRSSARSSHARLVQGAVDVALAPGQRDLATLVHELAHALAGVEHGHDVHFRRALVDVVAVVAGTTSARVLIDALVGFAVPIGPRPWPAPSRAEGDGFVLLGG